MRSPTLPFARGKSIGSQCVICQLGELSSITLVRSGSPVSCKHALRHRFRGVPKAQPCGTGGWDTVHPSGESLECSPGRYHNLDRITRRLPSHNNGDLKMTAQRKRPEKRQASSQVPTDHSISRMRPMWTLLLSRVSSLKPHQNEYPSRPSEPQ
jgi:hypothetical protein